MEYKEGGIEILLQSSKLNIMNKFMEFTEVTSQSLRYFSLLSRVDLWIVWLHGGISREGKTKSSNPHSALWLPGISAFTGSCRLFPRLWFLRSPPLAFMVLAYCLCS